MLTVGPCDKQGQGPRPPRPAGSFRRGQEGGVAPFPRPAGLGYKSPSGLRAVTAAFSLQQCLNGTGCSRPFVHPGRPSVRPSRRFRVHPSVRPSRRFRVHPSVRPSRHGLPDPPELPPRLRGRRQPHGQHGAPRLLRLPLHGLLLRQGRRGPVATGPVFPGAVAGGAGARRGAPALPDAPRGPRSPAGHQEAGAGHLGLGAGGGGSGTAAGEVGEPGAAGAARAGCREGGPPPL